MQFVLKISKLYPKTCSFGYIKKYERAAFVFCAHALSKITPSQQCWDGVNRLCLCHGELFKLVDVLHLHKLHPGSGHVVGTECCLVLVVVDRVLDVGFHPGA